MHMGKLLSLLGWILVAAAGGGAFAWLALSRGEQVSAAWLVTAADISSFETVRLTDATGRLLAAGTVSER